jgi:hypothetical protein
MAASLSCLPLPLRQYTLLRHRWIGLAKDWMHGGALGIFTLQTEHRIGLDCTYVNKFMTVKIKGRIDPRRFRELANARRINPSSVRM